MERNDGASSADKAIVHQAAGSGSDAEKNSANVGASSVRAPAPEPSTGARVPFTALDQVDSDMALARALQEQERAYFWLQVGRGGNTTDRFYYEGGHFDGPGGDEEGDVEDEYYDEEEEDVGEHDPEDADGEERAASDDQIDGAGFDNDEAFARALQDKEESDTIARLMASAGIHGAGREVETDSNAAQDGVWEDLDPDNMSYEELVALGEAVGTQSKGLDSHLVAALPQFTYASDPKENLSHQAQCVVCRFEYEDGDKMLRLPCNHQYHSECIQRWLERNKVCPVCTAEVSSQSSACATESHVD